jgi:hypothetical protein
MLSWISDTILGFISLVPTWLYAEGSPRYMIVRGMFGLLLVVLIVLIIALRPFRTVMGRSWRFRDRSKGDTTS